MVTCIHTVIELVQKVVREQVIPYYVGHNNYAFAHRLDPGQQPSNSASSLISNLFATQTIITLKKPSRFLRFWTETDT